MGSITACLSGMVRVSRNETQGLPPLTLVGGCEGAGIRIGNPTPKSLTPPAIRMTIPAKGLNLFSSVVLPEPDANPMLTRVCPPLAVSPDG